MATGVWMAKESGAFEKNGIQADIDFHYLPVRWSCRRLIGGDLHGGSAATNAVVNAILSGAPIIGVAGTANRPYHRLYVQPEINRVEDLKGKTLGVTRFGSITDNLTRILLRKAGLEGAVNVRQMGGTLEVAAAFQNRLIAGAVTSELRVTPPSQPKILVQAGRHRHSLFHEHASRSSATTCGAPRSRREHRARLCRGRCVHESAKGAKHRAIMKISPILRDPMMRN